MIPSNRLMFIIRTVWEQEGPVLPFKKSRKLSRNNVQGAGAVRLFCKC